MATTMGKNIEQGIEKGIQQGVDTVKQTAEQVLQQTEKVLAPVAKQVENVSEKIGETVFEKTGLSGMLKSNDIVSMVINLFLILYVRIIAPRLSHKLMPIIDNGFFKVGFFALLVYLHNVNPTTSILLASAFVLTIMFGTRYQKKQNIEQDVKLIQKKVEEIKNY